MNKKEREREKVKRNKVLLQKAENSFEKCHFF